jgi:hypothetical protein
VNAPLNAPQLGQLLLSRGLITPDELQLALDEKERSGRPLGEVIRDLRLVAPPVLADVLAAQQAWRPLGRMLVERDLLTEDELADVLAEQSTTDRRLGDIVKGRGLVSAARLDEVLTEQYRLEVELELGFGAGLRSEIERRHRLARHGEPGDDPTEPLNDPEPSEPKLRARLETTLGRDEADRIQAMHEALEDRERSLAALGGANQRKQQELEQLRAELAERDALIAALQRQLQERDGHVDGSNVHQLPRAADGRY